MSRCRSIAVSVMQKTWCSVPFDSDLVLTLARRCPASWLSFALVLFCFVLFDVTVLKVGEKAAGKALILGNMALPL